MKILLYCTCC